MAEADEQRWAADIGVAVGDLIKGEATLLERRLRPAGVGDTTLAAARLVPRIAVPATLVLPILDPLAANAVATLDHTSGTATILRLATRLTVAAEAAPVVITLTRLRNETSLLIGTVTIPAHALESVTTAADLEATDVRAGDWWLATCTSVGSGDTAAGLVLVVELVVAALLGDR